MKAWWRLFSGLGKGLVLATMVSSLALLPAGCDEDDDDPDYKDHNPPDGQGSLIIDNRTTDDVNVFIDGAFRDEVNDGDDETYDMAPGTYRVVIEEDDGGREYADDIDILDDRLTILIVRIDWGDDDYDVDVDID